MGCWVVGDLFAVRNWALPFQTPSPVTCRPNIKELVWPWFWSGARPSSSALSVLGQGLQGYVE